jgi:hypothetical protein
MMYGKDKAMMAKGGMVAKAKPMAKGGMVKPTAKMTKGGMVKKGKK